MIVYQHNKLMQYLNLDFTLKCSLLVSYPFEPQLTHNSQLETCILHHCLCMIIKEH